ncbi:DUF4260 domain-containing protein [Methylobacterium sp. E-066]|uniref:DUF4260 domain-containing protein n=1 Tax=Methylobacterium sp. E-066 TaxID=2836584 RepID=UPI001FBBC98B|nr:DUF4260 domain-containing protein [Methylobacterium sp. E-066]MCJ2139778.1 DUF4260 domain-containing protein [Methylobacterium sp. E-066]
MAGTVTGAPRRLLRLEGLVVLVAAAVTYGRLEASWWLFGLLFLAPNLTLLGYGAGRAAGAVLYNAGHWYGLPAACLAWGVLAPAPEILAAGLIWAAHIGFDRALGYGLKYPAGFGATHLGMIGTGSRT